MCVIIVCENDHPSSEMIEKMWKQNPHGAGAAWKADGKLHWKKGLSLEEVTELSPTLPLPYVMHFRLASVGGIDRKLTHPYTIDEFDNGLSLEGSTTGSLLFHNGHWGIWKDAVLAAAPVFGQPIPSGKWTDTRAMAWLTKLYGEGYLDLMGEKTIIMRPEGMRVIGSSG